MNLTTTQTRAKSPSTTNSDNLIEFRPWASSLVHMEIARRGYMGDSAIWRHAREWARHARVAAPDDRHAWKVEAGEVYTREHPRNVAERLGVSVGHVWNIMSAMRAEGLIQTRRCSQKRMSVVFLFETSGSTRTLTNGTPERSREGSHEDSSGPRSDPLSGPRTERTEQRAACSSRGTETKDQLPPSEFCSARQRAMACSIGRRVGVYVDEARMARLTRSEASRILTDLERREREFDSPEGRQARFKRYFKHSVEDPDDYAESLLFGRPYDRTFDLVLCHQ